MSIGDNLLDYFNKSKILNNKMNYYKNDNFITSDLSKNFKSDLYEGLQISFERDSFEIYEIEASISFSDKSESECIQQSKKIFNEISSMFPTAKKTDLIKKKLTYDASGQSIVVGRQLYFKNTDYIQVACFNMSEIFENKGYIDTLKVVLTKRKFADWRTKYVKQL